MDRLRRWDIGALLFGLIILGVGAYYTLTNIFGVNLPELDWDKVWPLAIVALGIGLIWGVWSRANRGGQQGA